MVRANRRSLLKFGLAAGIGSALPFVLRAETAGYIYAPAASDWRSFELETAVILPEGRGTTRIWLPLPELDTDWQRSLGNRWTGNARTAEIVEDADTGVRMLFAEFERAEPAPTLTLTSRVQTRNRTWPPASATSEDPAVLAAALAASPMKPLDGIVGETARSITAGATTDLDKVRAIYAWIVATCHLEPSVAGCGTGDIVAVLTEAGYGGKCADLNGLFVGLARAAGVPARDIYGVRVAPSAFGYQQLGGNPENLSGAQHCRAEVWLDGHGWVAMDPADVLKVMRQERAAWVTDLHDPLIDPVNRALFGTWEGNWVGFNTGERVTLPGPGSPRTLPFLMYPQGVDDDGPFDELAADAFAYKITARDV
jgi:transglutaminase-like putative cysteine protease